MPMKSRKADFRVFKSFLEQKPRKVEVKQAEKEREKDPNAVSLGRRGGLKGGKARAKKLSPNRLSELARVAANARWGVQATDDEKDYGEEFTDLRNYKGTPK